MLSEVEQIDVIRNINQHLLTPKGLRSLSPLNPVYGKGFVKDTHSGSVRVWPLALYVKACFDISGVAFLAEAKQILENFEEVMQIYGIGSVCEYYQADPPHEPRGAISQAWSVGALLEIADMIRQYSAMVPAEKPKRKVAAKPKAAVAKPKAAAAKPKVAAKPKAEAKPKAAPKKRAVKKSE